MTILLWKLVINILVISLNHLMKPNAKGALSIKLYLSYVDVSKFLIVHKNANKGTKDSIQKIVSMQNSNN